MEDRTVLGIDACAKNIRLATIISGHPEVLDIDFEKRFMRACVTYDEERKYIGEVAERQADVNPENAIANAKNFLAAKYRAVKDSRNELASLENINHQAYFNVRHKGRKELINPVQVIAEYLLHIRTITIKEKDLPVDRVIVTVPATYTNLQREAMLDASKIAGFDKVNLLNETTAAAIHYQATHDVSLTPKRVLFIDFGAMRITCSIVKFNGQDITVKKYTCTKIGGSNFDDALVDHFSKLIDAKKLCQHKISKDLRALRRLRAACEKVKRDLSMVGDKGKVKMLVSPLFNNGSSFEHVLSRKEFEDICKEQYLLALNCVDRITTSNKVIHDVVLIGGSSRLPLFKNTIWKKFDLCNTKMSADESVCNGAAIYASWSLQELDRVKDICCFGYEIVETVGKLTKSRLLIEPFKQLGHLEKVEFKTSTSNTSKVEIREIPIGEVILSELLQVNVKQSRLIIVIDRNSTIKIKLEVKRWVEVNSNPMQISYVNDELLGNIRGKIGIEDEKDDCETEIGGSATSILCGSTPLANGHSNGESKGLARLAVKIDQILERGISSTAMVGKANQAKQWVDAHTNGRPVDQMKVAQAMSELYYYEESNKRSLSVNSPIAKLASVMSGPKKIIEEPQTSNGHSSGTNGGTDQAIDDDIIELDNSSDNEDESKRELRV